MARTQVSRIQYLVTWVNADEIKAAAAKAGMPADCDAILDYAPPENHQSAEAFRALGSAIRFATDRLADDFFGQVEIEEQEEEIEAMGGGVTLNSWETRRYCHVTAAGVSEWERR